MGASFFWECFDIVDSPHDSSSTHSFEADIFSELPRRSTFDLFLKFVLKIKRELQVCVSFTYVT